ncbi:unnamed protein product [Rhizophagus irregularis]|uniref:Uncharacterized protein n=1 Tax=Rhizophagus irregularis TaxID=588596 RepID=A0A915Z302_9GLOM|nr:unnamed protein product [Rhizophagus irregularis]CAB5358936.1 unnamed protein product [Rhizophagus irregularis]
MYSSIFKKINDHLTDLRCFTEIVKILHYENIQNTRIGGSHLQFYSLLPSLLYKKNLIKITIAKNKAKVKYVGQVILRTSIAYIDKCSIQWME